MRHALSALSSLPAAVAIAFAAASLGSLAGCGGEQSESSGPKTATTSAPVGMDDAGDNGMTVKAPPSDLAPEVAPGSSIPRTRIQRAVDAGLGAFLQHVSLDDSPVMIDGKFHGFRVAELKGHMFDGVDLKPGDVVTQVNGFPIERPEQAMEAFQSLAVATELRVDYDRDGKARELRFPIAEDAEPIQAQATGDAGVTKPATSKTTKRPSRTDSRRERATLNPVWGASAKRGRRVSRR